jgi:hypothetical protein
MMPVVEKPYRLFMNRRLSLVATALLLTCSCISLKSQTKDTAKQESPIQKKLNLPKKHSPKLAAIMSAVVPGAGQVYNKKYWKVPIIYAGAIGLGYSFNFNQNKYLDYRNAYKARLDNDPATVDNYPRYSDSDLNTLQRYYHRYRDLSIIGGTILYFLNVIDASVDAHLFDFSMEDEDLSFKVQPTLINTYGLNQYTTGVSLSLRF